LKALTESKYYVLEKPHPSQTDENAKERNPEDVVPHGIQDSGDDLYVSEEASHEPVLHQDE